MSSLSGLKTQSLLEQIVMELREIKEIVAESSGSTYPTLDIPPYIPSRPTTHRTAYTQQCAKCGLNMSVPLSYTCSDPECPSGLGPTTC